MLRAMGSVLLGYLVIVLVIMVSFTLLWTVLGQGRAFHAGTTDVTWVWLAFTLPLNVAAAVLGGMVTVRVARSKAFAGILGLAGLILVLGVASAFTQMGTPPTPGEGSGPGTLGAVEAAMQARQPLWVAWSLPLLGAMGAVLGGMLVFQARARRGRARQEAAPQPPA